MPIATLAEVKAFLGITGTDSDGRITAFLEPVSTMIERFTRRAWQPASHQLLLPGGERALLVTRLPITDVTSITDMVAGTVLDPVAYHVQEDTGQIFRLPFGMFWHTMGDHSPFGGAGDSGHYGQRWQVAYTGGPSEAPADVKAALYLTVQALLAGTAGMKSEKDGDYSYTREDGAGVLPMAALSILSAHTGNLY